MPGFDGTGPRGNGRPGRGRGQALRNRQAQLGPHVGATQNTPAAGDYFYEYTLEELRERKKALEQEIRWIEDRIREMDPPA